MKDAVIFDMDGLLLDTEVIALRTFKEVCGDLGITFDMDVYRRCIGCNMQKIDLILAEFLPGYKDSNLIPHWNAAYREEAILKPVPTKTGVIPLLKDLKNWGIPMAVATSTAHKTARSKLENAGIMHFFDDLVGGDMVTDSKPHPEIYLKAADAIKTNPRHCLALEDSDNGVRAAHAAGMLVFQVPDMVDPAAEVRALGHEIVDSLHHVHRRFIPPTG